MKKNNSILNKTIYTFAPTIKALLILLVKIFYRVKTYHVPKLKKDHGYLIVSNHTCNLDGPLHFGIIKNKRIISKSELFEIKVGDEYIPKGIAPALERIGLISVRRGTADIHSLKECLKTLNDKQSLVVFFQGAIKQMEDTTTDNLKEGAAVLSLYAKNVTVIPAFIQINSPLVTHFKIDRIPKFRTTVRVMYGPEMSFPKSDLPIKVQRKKRTNQIYEQILSLQEQLDQIRELETVKVKKKSKF